ncbi:MULTISPECIES: hypothetical protein [Corynebacterium]|uniref:Uncharacterized protein n=1 Tax=Corynebacterium pseudokroppenstedtii TaxID=2804917 RepID=A0AAU0PVY9_9CORY|nr:MULTISPECIES: hypothetical protein [Corynebacterium]MBY0797857.1 hypothetical protein [Corynebacterium parakroppenstedtii]MCF8703300.1 hypothetical protein [Corynebacterium pseudokroppenstedtii]MCG2636813.1 hypothetical protein [Corynebacterium pseudokroppenstedtii]
MSALSLHDMLRSTLSTTHPLTVRAITSCCPGHSEPEVIEALRDLELAGQAEETRRGWKYSAISKKVKSTTKISEITTER